MQVIRVLKKKTHNYLLFLTEMKLLYITSVSTIYSRSFDKFLRADCKELELEKNL